MSSRLLSRAAPLDEVADQMRENVFIGHTRDGCCKKRVVELCSREDSLRGHTEQAVREETMMYVEAERPRVAHKRASGARTHGRFEAEGAQDSRHHLEVGRASQKVDVDEITLALQDGPPAEQERTLQRHQYDAALGASLHHLIRQPQCKLANDGCAAAVAGICGGLGHDLGGIDPRWLRIKGWGISPRRSKRKEPMSFAFTSSDARGSSSARG